MKGNLLQNLKNYIIKMSKKYKDLDVIQYYKLIYNNQKEFEELTLESAVKDYDLSIEQNECNGYNIKILFHYNEPNVIYTLSFEKYIDIKFRNEYDYRLEIIKKIQIGQWSLNGTVQEIKYDDEEDKKYCESFIINNIKTEIAWKKQYIEFQKMKIYEMEQELLKLNAC